jgi:hypothetical protein
MSSRGLRRVCLAGLALALGLPTAAFASAREPLGPSPADCAASWSALSSGAQRATLAADRPLRAWIIPTSAPSCVIHFLLSGTRVLTATSTWAANAAGHWQLTLRPRSSFDTRNAQLLPDGRLRANGSDANLRYPVRPLPTVATCLAAWNSRGGSALRAFAGKSSRPVAITANGAPPGQVHGVITVGAIGSKPSTTVVHGIDIIGGVGSKPSTSDCVLTVPTTAQDVTQVIGVWSAGNVTAWRTIAKLPAADFGVPPNAFLLRNGALQPQLN